MTDTHKDERAPIGDQECSDPLFEVQRIGGVDYRLARVRNDEQTIEKAVKSVVNPLDGVIVTNDDIVEEECCEDERAQETHRSVVNVPPYVCSHLFKGGRSQVKAIQRATGAEVSIISDEAGTLEVCGESEESVRRGEERIEKIVKDRLKKLPPTHFLSIPLNPERKRAFDRDVTDFCEKNAVSGFDSSILVPPERFHFSLLMLKIFRNEQLESAMEILKSCEKDVRLLFEDFSTKKMQLVGVLDVQQGDVTLEMMNEAKTRSMHVLAARMVDGEMKSKIVSMQHLLAERFDAAGLLHDHSDVSRRLLLHGTLLNTVSRKMRGGKPRDPQSAVIFKKGKRMPFDGTALVDRYAAYDFGELVLSEIHLSERTNFVVPGVRQIGRKNAPVEGFYPCVSKITLLSE